MPQTRHAWNSPPHPDVRRALHARFAGARRGALVAEFIDRGPLRRRAARLVLILCHRQTGYRDIRVVCET